MMNRRAIAFAFAFGLAALPAAARAEITVFAAASLKNALDAASVAWQAGGGGKVVLSYAATPEIARQIEAGAPADIFISASLEWMDKLEAAGLTSAEDRRNLLASRIVLIAPAGTVAAEPGAEIGPGLDLAGMLGAEGRLAMAMTDSVPAGIYGREALTNLGLWDGLKDRLAESENVRAALAFVASGEAPLGIVYTTDAAVEPKVTVIGVFPETSHRPILYPAALVAASAAPDQARAFLEYLSGPEARAIFAAQGFTLPAP